MPDIQIKSFTDINKSVRENAFNNFQAYMRTLHCDYKALDFDPKDYCNEIEEDDETSEGNKGRLVVMFMNDKHCLNGRPEKIISKFMDYFLYNDRMDGNVYCTTNLFNGFLCGDKPKPNQERSSKYLYGIDHLMIDIDYGEIECNNYAENADENSDNYIDQIETIFVQQLLYYCKDHQLPIPNAYSFTGTGGIHLYYQTTLIKPALKDAVRGIKYILANKINDCVNQFNEDYGTNYHIDTKVFDDVRMDRIPGTMNPKTGRMCEFFVCDGVERYTFKKMLSYLTEQDCDDEIDWNRFSKRMQKYCVEKNKSKIILSDYRKKAKKSVKKSDYTAETFVPVAEKRIRGFFMLQDEGFSFDHCREVACFMLRSCCKAAKYSPKQEADTLAEFNSRFANPLSPRELSVNSRAKKIYKMTNHTIAEGLGLEDDDELFVKAFGRVKKHVEKKYGFSSQSERNICNYQLVSNYMIKNKSATIREVSNNTGVSIDCTKRAMSYIHKKWTS